MAKKEPKMQVLDLSPVLKDGPSGVWVALSRDKSKIVGTGVTMRAAVLAAEQAGESEPYIVKMPPQAAASVPAPATRYCVSCRYEINACNGFVKAGDLMDAIGGKRPFVISGQSNIRELCGRCALLWFWDGDTLVKRQAAPSSPASPPPEEKIESMTLADEPCPDCGSRHHRSCVAGPLPAQSAPDECERCYSMMQIREGEEPTEICDHCAQDLVIELRAELARVLSELGEQFEHDRTVVAAGVHAVKEAVAHRDWLTEGRGPYEWNDDNWHKEFAAAAKEILEAVEPLAKVAADWSNCPKDPEAISAARVDLKAQLARATKELRQAKLAYGQKFNENAALEGQIDELCDNLARVKDKHIAAQSRSRELREALEWIAKYGEREISNRAKAALAAPEPSTKATT